MLLKSLENLKSFEAGDKTQIIEILHPQNDAVSLDYSLAHASLEVGEASLPHVLEACSETYFILKGEARVVIGEESAKLKEGDTVLIPAGASQYIENLGNTRLEFLCIVSPAWFEEQERIL